MLEMETTKDMIGSSSTQKEKPPGKLEFFLILIALKFFPLSSTISRKALGMQTWQF